MKKIERANMIAKNRMRREAVKNKDERKKKILKYIAKEIKPIVYGIPPKGMEYSEKVNNAVNEFMKTITLYWSEDRLDWVTYYNGSVHRRFIVPSRFTHSGKEERIVWGGKEL